MRVITVHHVNPCNRRLKLQACEDTGPGGDSNQYHIDLINNAGVVQRCFHIPFQSGPVQPDGEGTNGLTNEVLLAIVQDRLHAFILGPYNCTENRQALDHIDLALGWLKQRTERRQVAGVEGTMAPETPATPTQRNPAVANVLQFFSYSHLPSHLQDVSKPFCELAEKIANGPQNPESTVALRKLLEAKDAAVRAVLFKAQ